MRRPFLNPFLDPRDQITAADLHHREEQQQFYEYLMGTGIALGGLGGQLFVASLDLVETQLGRALFWIGIILIAVGILSILVSVILDLRTAFRTNHHPPG